MEINGSALRQILAANIKEQRRILGVSQEKLAAAKKAYDDAFTGIYGKI
jgi:hypothetical protein